MSTHLYCILPDDQRLEDAIPAGLRGVSGAEVRVVRAPGMVAWVSDAEGRTPLAVDRVRAQSLIDGVRSHDGVIEAALDTGSTPLPARFGQRFDDDDACISALAHRRAEIEPLLSLVQGRVEMTLIITPSTRRMLRELQPVFPEMVGESAEGGGAGRRYLETLRAREAATGAVRHAIDELQARLDAAAKPFTERSAVHEPLTKGASLRTLSHLIARDAVDGYKGALETVPPGREFRFLVIGPRAPYSFCDFEHGSGGAHGMKLAD